MSAITNVKIESYALPERGTIKRLHEPTAREKLIQDIYTSSINRIKETGFDYVLGVASLARDIFKSNKLELKTIKDMSIEDKLAATLDIVEQVVTFAKGKEKKVERKGKKSADKKTARSEDKKKIEYSFVHNLTCYCIFDQIDSPSPSRQNPCCVIC